VDLVTAHGIAPLIDQQSGQELWPKYGFGNVTTITKLSVPAVGHGGHANVQLARLMACR
jgi:hypothetical protein